MVYRGIKECDCCMHGHFVGNGEVICRIDDMECENYSLFKPYPDEDY